MVEIAEMKVATHDLEAIFMLKGEMVNGYINVDPEYGIKEYFNNTIESLSFIPVYNVTWQNVEKRTYLLDRNNIDWVSPNIESEPLRDSVLEGDYNSIPVAIKIADHTFQGDINLGSYNRLSDRLNDTTSLMIPLFNVDYRRMKRTIFINRNSILSVTEL